ncbi:MAG: tetratricopeptide repeat protein [Treponema sp.]|nr:tetratricopeptide repeat protein [Treponema sp.]
MKIVSVIMGTTMQHRSPPLMSSILYSISIGIFLFHLHLLAAPLSNIQFFLMSLVLGFSVGLAGAKVYTLKRKWMLIVILSIPWILKVLLICTSFIVPRQSISFDRFLLFFDRNFIISLFPFYWIGLSTFMAKLSFKALHWNRIANGILLLLFFLVLKSKNFTFYLWPTQMLAIFALIILLQFAALLMAYPYKVQSYRKNKFWALFILLLIGLFSILLVRKPAEEQAAEQGGGLIKPDLFRFDFSQFLRLESEISLKEDLVLILHKDPEDSHILLRRYILSGYGSKKGFYRDPSWDEAEHPQELPPAALVLQSPAWQDRRDTEQEYFLINFDPSALIALNSPRSIQPLKAWDTTSFSSAYRVISETSEAMPFQLLDSVPEKDYQTGKLGLSSQEYQWYTNFGGDTRIKALGDSITEGLETYWEKVQAIYEYLKYGDYRYSLKPGIASDGDQLGRFLFETKKGYCSYFAFSMVLLLRSQGIPSRVAVGFFINPETGAFNYYPVLSNMAHAWVEVYYPGYGWIEYDPTTTQLAENEQFRFSQGAQQETFERLLGEILQNRSKLSPLNDTSDTTKTQNRALTFETMQKWIRAHWIILVVLLYLFIVVYFGYGHYCRYLYHLFITKKNRPAAKALFLFSIKKLSVAGIYKKPQGSSLHTLQEEIFRIERNFSVQIIPLYNIYQKANFASPDQNIAEDEISCAYRTFVESYKKGIHPIKRFLAVIFPFSCGSSGKLLSLIFLGSLLFTQSGLQAQNNTSNAQDTEIQNILLEVQQLRQEERWEQVITILQNAKKQYPDDSRIHTELGDIFESRGLYSLAWNEYLQAERLAGDNIHILYQLSSVAGRLNKNDDSIRYLQKILLLDPGNRDALADLGWMYFKTHRLAEGEKLLTDALDRYGPDQGLEMTLGTIYSDQYRYTDAKQYYQRAIKQAEKSGYKLFLSVAYYNLSILETRFYHFADAFNCTHLSLQYAERASGHLARGELYQHRLDFTKAYAEYTAAYEMDTSPLSKINLSQLYQQTGNLENARSYAENTLSQSDLSWMVNYGTDYERYKMDLHTILVKTYEGLADLQRFTYKATLHQALVDSIKWIHYKTLALWHQLLLTYYTIQTADAYGTGNQKLNALIHYFLALKQYPWRAESYLLEAMHFETSIIEASRPTYFYELGTLKQDPELLENAIAQFDPVWERDMIADAYMELAKIYKKQGRQKEAQVCIEGLYALNRGALLQQGIRLPINLEIQGQFPDATTIIKVLKQTGLQILNNPNGRYTLKIKRQGDSVQWALFDNHTGAIRAQDNPIELPYFDNTGLVRFSRQIQRVLFSELTQ